jgi:DNA-directed RNA polymerase specialized sigma24 family protein
MENTTIDQLFKEKRPTLKYLAAQFTSDPDEREDLVQETMVRITIFHRKVFKTSKAHVLVIYYYEEYVY